MQAVGDEGGEAGGPGLFGGLDFGHHAAAPQGAGAFTRGALDVGVDGLHLVQQAGVGMFPGVLIEEAVDVGEEHQEVGAHQVADQGGQVVVVPELELVGGHGVVFVDDGHHLPAQQGEQGVPGVEEAGPGFQVVVG